METSAEVATPAFSVFAEAVSLTSGASASGISLTASSAAASARALRATGGANGSFSGAAARSIVVIAPLRPNQRLGAIALRRRRRSRRLFALGAFGIPIRPLAQPGDLALQGNDLPHRPRHPRECLNNAVSTEQRIGNHLRLPAIHKNADFLGPRHPDGPQPRQLLQLQQLMGRKPPSLTGIGPARRNAGKGRLRRCVWRGRRHEQTYTEKEQKVNRFLLFTHPVPSSRAQRRDPEPQAPTSPDGRVARIAGGFRFYVRSSMRKSPKDPQAHSS
jgi:hypothetical protein